MNILIFNWKDLKNPDVGGAEIITFEIAKRLVKKGHKITIFTRSFKGAQPEETVDGINIVRRGNSITTYLYAPLYYLSIKEKPDIVIDMVNTICWQTPLFVKCKKLGYVNQLAREVLFYELPWPISIIAYHLEKLQFFLYRNVHFACYSQSTKNDLVGFGIPPEIVHVFSIGLDHERYFPTHKAKDPLFIAVGRLVRMKRFDLCIRALALVVKKYPKAKLAIIGYGKELDNLKRLAVDLNVSDNVDFFGKDDALFFKKSERDVKVKLMQQAWALLMPSVKEGWGLVVTEANSCGTPAIVSNVTGLCDSVINGFTGLVISKDPTPEELANAMILLIEDSKLRRRLSENAVEWAKQFSWEKSCDEFCKILEKVVSK